MSLHCEANFQMRPEFYEWLSETLFFHEERRLRRIIDERKYTSDSACVWSRVPVVLNEVFGEQFENYVLSQEDEYRVFSYLMLREFGVVVNVVR